MEGVQMRGLVKCIAYVKKGKVLIIKESEMGILTLITTYENENNIRSICEIIYGIMIINFACNIRQFMYICPIYIFIYIEADIMEALQMKSSYG